MLPKRVFLKGMRAEREKRRLEKNREISANKIRAFWGKWKKGHVCRTGLRQEFLSTYKNILQCVDQNVAPETLVSMLRHYLMAYYFGSADEAVENQVMHLVICSCSSDLSGPRLTNLATSRPAFPLQGNPVLFGLCRFSLRVLRRHLRGPGSLVGTAKLLLLLSSDAAWLPGEGATGPASSPHAAAYLTYLFEHGPSPMYEFLARTIKESTGDPSVQRSAVLLSLRPLHIFSEAQGGGTRNKCATELALQILSDPHVATCLPEDVLATLRAPDVWSSVLPALESSLEGLVDVPSVVRLHLLGVLSDVLVKLSQASDKDSVHSLLLCGTRALAHLAGSFDKASPAGTRFESPQALMDQASPVLQPRIALLLFETTLRQYQQDPSAGADLQAICTLYMTILLHCENTPKAHIGRDLVNSLAFHGRGIVVRWLWEWLEGSGAVREAVAAVFHGPDVTKLREIDKPLSLYLLLYTRLLGVLEDDEIFSGVPFPIDTLASMTRALTCLLFGSHWMLIPLVSDLELESDDEDDDNGALDRGPDGGALTYLPLLGTLVKALRARHERKELMEEDEWKIHCLLRSSGSVQPLSEKEFLTAALEEWSAQTTLRKETRILTYVPFSVPFEWRIKFFNNIIGVESPLRGIARSFWKIRRDSLYEDAYAAFMEDRHRMHEFIQVQFVSRAGHLEAGIDGGGLYKEFMTELCKEAFSQERGLFIPTHENKLYPNPHSAMVHEDHLQQYEFLGMVLGKAIYDSVLLDLPLAPFFLSKLLGKSSSIDDLRSLDPELHRQLNQLKSYPGDMEDLGLTFTIADSYLGKVNEVELCPGGAHISVKKENYLRYVHLISNYKLNRQIREQCKYFLRGFTEVLRPVWLKLFGEHDLAMLIMGDQEGFDLLDLRAFTTYGGFYDDNHETIQLFWAVMQEFSPKERAGLLRFVTSLPRPPLLGFQYLTPRFGIIPSVDEGGTERLPSASTCANLLKLPPYTDKEKMKQKLLQAMAFNTGFEMS
eukprot:Rmarinus@m.768